LGKFIPRRKYGDNAFEVLLLDHEKLARTFNVSTMKPSIVDYIRKLELLPLYKTDIVKRSTNGAWEVEKIVGNNHNLEEDRRLEFEVKWENFEGYA
jgi:hypothetical protein